PVTCAYRHPDRRDSSGPIDETAELGWSIDASHPYYDPLACLGPAVRSWEGLKSATALEERMGASMDLQMLTNRCLRKSCSPALLLEPNGLSFCMRMVPHHLLGFMWVQFAEAVAGGKEFRQCASCSRWMEIAPGQGRPEKHYCSDACRMRAYRKRKAER